MMTATQKQRPFVIRDARAVRVLASPIRQALLDMVVARGPLTVAELSEHLGRPADRLYYHVRLLEKAGLFIDCGGVNVTGRSEVRYDVPGRPMQLAYELATPAKRRATARVLSGVLRSASRDVDRTLADKGVRTEGRQRELWAGRIEGALSAEDLAHVNAALQTVLDEISTRRKKGRSSGRYYQFTWALSPAQPVGTSTSE